MISGHKFATRLLERLALQKGRGKREFILAVIANSRFYGFPARTWMFFARKKTLKAAGGE